MSKVLAERKKHLLCLHSISIAGLFELLSPFVFFEPPLCSPRFFQPWHTQVVARIYILMLFDNTPHVTCKNEDTCVIDSIEIGDVNTESFQIKHKQDLGVTLFCGPKSNIGYGQVGRLQPHF